MQELFEYAFLPVNFPYTLFLIFVLIYWLSVIIGALDIEFMDIDLDLDADADIDLDMDADVGGGGGFLKFLGFLNIGAVPIMISLSFFALSLWAGAVLGHYYLTGATFIGAAIWLLPNLIAGLFVTKVLTQPLKSVFKDRNHSGHRTHNELIGQTAQVALPARGKKIGQADIGTSRVAIRSEDGSELPKNANVVLVFYDEEKEIYTAELM